MTLPELGMDENDYLTAQDVVLYNIGNLLHSVKGHLTRLLKILEQRGFIVKYPRSTDKELSHL